jgi:hypothetical protein
MLRKSDVIFALVILNDIAAGGDAEHLDQLLRDILAASGWLLGESRQHNLVAIKDGVALSGYDSPLIQRAAPEAPQPMPDNVRPIRPLVEVSGSEE